MDTELALETMRAGHYREKHRTGWSDAAGIPGLQPSAFRDLDLDALTGATLDDPEHGTNGFDGSPLAPNDLSDVALGHVDTEHCVTTALQLVNLDGLGIVDERAHQEL